MPTKNDTLVEKYNELFGRPPPIFNYHDVTYIICVASQTFFGSIKLSHTIFMTTSIIQKQLDIITF